MILKTYKLAVSPPECLPSAVTVSAQVDFDDDLEELLPYLNSEFAPCVYDADVPFLRFKRRGKIFAVYPKRILINPLSDEEEAEEVFRAIREEINSVAERKQEIQPSTWSLSSLKPLDIFRLLPRTNCGLCKKVTCMAFAAAVAGGEALPESCPVLLDDPQKHAQLLELFKKE
jgi:ArsR family metal-binding transcriptional regulator